MGEIGDKPDLALSISTNHHTLAWETYLHNDILYRAGGWLTDMQNPAKKQQLHKNMHLTGQDTKHMKEIKWLSAAIINSQQRKSVHMQGPKFMIEDGTLATGKTKQDTQTVHATKLKCLDLFMRLIKWI